MTSERAGGQTARTRTNERTNGSDGVERTDGRTNGRTGEQTEGRTDGRTEMRTDGLAEGRTDGQTDGRTHGLMDDETNERTDVRTDGRTGGTGERRTYGQTDVQVELAKDGRRRQPNGGGFGDVGRTSLADVHKQRHLSPILLWRALSVGVRRCPSTIGTATATRVDGEDSVARSAFGQISRGSLSDGDGEKETESGALRLRRRSARSDDAADRERKLDFLRDVWSHSRTLPN